MGYKIAVTLHVLPLAILIVDKSGSDNHRNGIVMFKIGLLLHEIQKASKRLVSALRPTPLKLVLWRAAYNQV
jgi:hypothetical protein